MSPEDKTLTCADCGATFVFTASEQAFFQSKGYTNEPKRCPACREARKSQRQGGDGSRTQRQMFTVTCDSCGKECQVPFEPREGRPVYCSDCFTKIKNSQPR